MIILALQEVRKSFGTHEVLKSVSFTLQQGERMGMVGVNGSGKSTLMKIIAGLETADSGCVNLQKDLKIGYLAQQGELTGEETVIETLESVFEPQRQMEAEMRRMELEMAEVAADPDALRRLGGRYDALTREFERSNGYGWRSSVQGVLAGLKLREYQDMKTGLLSGGERTRLCLGRMLLTEPDLLLLDEPTNHLDLKSIAWLEEYLTAYRGAVLVISHDRYFLDRVCGRMAELLLGTVETYTGNYTALSTRRLPLKRKSVLSPKRRSVSPKKRRQQKRPPSKRRSALLKKRRPPRRLPPKRRSALPKKRRPLRKPPRKKRSALPKRRRPQKRLLSKNASARLPRRRLLKSAPSKRRRLPRRPRRKRNSASPRNRRILTRPSRKAARFRPCFRT